MPNPDGSEYGDGLEPDREPRYDHTAEDRTDREERDRPADLAAPQQTTTGAVNRDLKAAQQSQQQSQQPSTQDPRATTLSTAEPAASMADPHGAPQDSMSGDAVRTRPQTTPMRPAPAPAADPDAVLERETSRQFRERWHSIQAEFVDDPRHAVEAADQLLTDVTHAFTSRLEEHRRALTSGQQRDGHGETEELRLAMRRYRVLVDAMLHD